MLIAIFNPNIVCRKIVSVREFTSNADEEQCKTQHEHFVPMSAKKTT